ncbi:MAG: hypothetical protein P1U40_11500 [Coxiellaceae bacterium]|nr:hypothetical protein [Coxiellaceae bacterium]
MPILKDSGLEKATEFLNRCVGLLQAHVDGRFPSVSLPDRLASIIAPDMEHRGSASGGSSPVLGDRAVGGMLYLPNGASFSLPKAFAESHIVINQIQWANPSVKTLVQAIYWMNQIVEHNDNSLLDPGDASGNTPAELVREGFEYCFVSFRNALDARTETFFPVVSDELSKEYTGLIGVFVGQLDPVSDISSNVLSRIPGIPGGSVGGTMLGFLAKRLAQVSSTIAGKINKVKQSAVNAMQLNSAVLDPSLRMAERTMKANHFSIKVKEAFAALHDCANKTTFTVSDIESLKAHCDVAEAVIGSKAAAEVTRADIAEIYKLTVKWVTENMAAEVRGVFDEKSFVGRLAQLQMTLLSSGHETDEVDALSFDQFEKAEQSAEQQWIDLFQQDKQLRADLADTGVALGDSMIEHHLANVDGAAVTGRKGEIVAAAETIIASLADSIARESVTDGVVGYKRDNAKGALADRLVAAFTMLKARPNSKAALLFAYAELFDVHVQLKHLLGHTGVYRDYPATNTFSNFGIHLTEAFKLMVPIVDAMQLSNDAELVDRLLALPAVEARALVEPVAEVSPAGSPVTPVDASSATASSGSDGDASPSPTALPSAAKLVTRLGVVAAGASPTAASVVPAEGDDGEDDFVFVSTPTSGV